jgi:hypothetical protein
MVTDSIQFVGFCAFMESRPLQSVAIPDLSNPELVIVKDRTLPTLSNTPDLIGDNLFTHCHALQTIFFQFIHNFVQLTDFLCLELFLYDFHHPSKRSENLHFHCAPD